MFVIAGVFRMKDDGKPDAVPDAARTA